ncbi:MAG: site-2 protease family protein, partial [Bacteroidales bacterium]|nr:site-2 protease family protein [Bacteroidales bacterium]
MVVLLKIIQVILALSLLVLFHEFGHYSFAKLFKTRVEKFYLFFNPRLSLVKFKRFDGKWHCKFFSPNDDPDWDAHPDHTEYGIGWLPFGGYCKIAGMIDESMDTEAMKQPPQPYEFRTKKTWQRFFIMFGGVLFNFILAIILYAAILGTWGEEYLRNEDAVYGVAVNDLSYEIGFRDGDRILAFDGERVENFSNLQVDLVRSQAREATVLRGADTLTVAVDPVYLPAMLNTPGMFDLAFPFVVKEVPADSPNASAGLQPGDAFEGINGQKMFIVQQIQKELLQHREQSVTAEVRRGGTSLEFPLQVDTAGHVGVLLDTDLNKFFKVTTR